jgi:hypothetical protein
VAADSLSLQSIGTSLEIASRDTRQRLYFNADGSPDMNGKEVVKVAENFLTLSLSSVSRSRKQIYIVHQVCLVI